MTKETKKSSRAGKKMIGVKPALGEASKKKRAPGTNQPSHPLILETKVKDKLLELRKCTMEELEVGLATAAELAQDKTIKLQSMYRMLLKGKSKADILAFAQSEWGMTFKSAEAYFREAQVMIKETAIETQYEAMEWHLAARKMLLSEFYDREDLANALNTLKDLAKLQALYSTDKAALAKAGLDESQANRERDSHQKLGEMLSMIMGNPHLDTENKEESGEEEDESEED